MGPEWRTRKLRIDGRLKAAGWEVRPWREGLSLAGLGPTALEEYPTANGPADYALAHRGRVIGVVEAKRAGVAPGNVLGQAERYARGLEETPFVFGEFRAPFLYSSNGEQIWFEDVRAADYRGRELAAFHTPAALEELLGRELGVARAWLVANQNTHPLRPYQLEAIAAAEQAVAASKRRML